MEKEENGIAERLEAATTLLEQDAELAGRAARRFDRRGGEDFGDRGAEPARRGAGGEAGRGRAGAGRVEGCGRAECAEPAAQDACPRQPAEMLAKHGIGEGPVDVRTLDAALSGLSLEQRIAVKTQLLRAGAIA